MLALCPGSKNVWVAYRHHLLKVSQEQLRMARITGRVEDDVVVIDGFGFRGQLGDILLGISNTQGPGMARGNLDDTDMHDEQR